MNSSLIQPNLPTPLAVSEKRGNVAKVAHADLRKTEKDELWAELGKCMVSVCYDAQLSLKEFAASLGKDAAQIQRQMEGKERPQIEAVFAVRRYRPALVIAMARLTNEVETFTEIRVRRSA